MEIWIVGGIIVAIMIYASTKIKRAAASAYERETIETSEFSIIKPEGFISPATTPYKFEAHTKEFGASEESEELHQAWATITQCEIAEPDSTSENDGEEKGVPVREFKKVLTRNGRTLELSVVVLADHLAELEPLIIDMIGSFEVK
jgi:hypothetical protein